eukprot:GHVP01036682.1.p1 GENE.GHVP01036682.1~~GHVP01036682.1.p1  ORF type:complete len:1054 (+),score=218.03 GHVP01036682.1:283-3162(+)
MKRLFGHFSGAYLTSFSNNGRLLATGGEEGCVKIWSTETGRLLRSLRGHSKGLCDLMLSPDCSQLVTCSYDKTMKVWDVLEGNILDQIDDFTSVVSVSYHPLFSKEHPYILYAAEDGVVVLLRWNFDEKVLSPERNIFPCRTVSKDRLLCASFSLGGARFVIGGTDGILRVFRTPDEAEFMERHIKHKEQASKRGAKSRISLPSKNTEMISLEEHLGWITCISFTPDGKVIATGSTDGTIRKWWYCYRELQWVSSEILAYKAVDGYEDGSLSVCKKQESLPERPIVDYVVFSCDGRYMFSCIRGKNSVYVWDSYTSKLLYEFKYHDSEICVLDSHPDFPGLFLSCSSEGKIVIAMSTGEVLMEDSTAEKPIDGRFSEHGEYFIIADELGAIYIYSFGQDDLYISSPDQQYFGFETEEFFKELPNKQDFKTLKTIPEESNEEAILKQREILLRQVLQDFKDCTKRIQSLYGQEMMIFEKEMGNIQEVVSDPSSEEKRLRERRRKVVLYELKEDNMERETVVLDDIEMEEIQDNNEETITRQTRRSTRIRTQGQEHQTSTRDSRRLRRARLTSLDSVEEDEEMEESEEFDPCEVDDNTATDTSLEEVHSDEDSSFVFYKETEQTKAFYYPQKGDLIYLSSAGYEDFRQNETRSIFESNIEHDLIGIVNKVEFFNGPPLSYTIDVIPITEKEANCLVDKEVRFKNPIRKNKKILSLSMYPNKEEFIVLYKKYVESVCMERKEGDEVFIIGEEAEPSTISQISSMTWKGLEVCNGVFYKNISPWEIKEPTEQKALVLFGDIERVLIKFMKKSLYKDFVYPVDTDYYKEYLSVVPHPMCLSIIHRRCTDGFYRSIDAIESDVDLILHNARLYNRRDSDIVRTCRDMIETLKEEISLYKENDGVQDSFELIEEELERKFEWGSNKLGGPSIIRRSKRKRSRREDVSAPRRSKRSTRNPSRNTYRD